MIDIVQPLKNKDQKINELKTEESRLLQEAYKFRELLLKTQLLLNDLDSIDNDFVSIIDKISLAYFDKKNKIKELSNHIGNI